MTPGYAARSDTAVAAVPFSQATGAARPARARASPGGRGAPPTEGDYFP